MKRDFNMFIQTFSRNEIIFWSVLMVVSYLLGMSYISSGILIYCISKTASKKFRITSYILLGIIFLFDFIFNVLRGFIMQYVIDNDLLSFIGESIGERYNTLNYLSFMIPYIIGLVIYLVIYIMFVKTNNKDSFKFLNYYLIIYLLVNFVNTIFYVVRINFNILVFPNVSFLNSIGYILLVIQFLKLKYNISFEFETYGKEIKQIEE